MIVSFGTPMRAKATLAALFLLAALFGPVARGADKNKKEKLEKEKKEKVEPWVEIRTPHFIVASDGGPATARRIADEFESLLRVFQATMPNSRVTTGVPVRILASRDGQSFARMIPEFPYDKRHEQPPGLMVAGAEETYIGIRANAAGHFPYSEIFQNYARQVLKLSYRSLPPWLEEGFSTVYGSVTFNDRGVRLERPEPEDLSVLFESPLLPLDLVLHVDRSSDYYSPGNKGTVYFAESRVLVHYLISDPQFVGSKSMERYVNAVTGGADSLKAARDAFGDLNQLQAKLDAFIKNVAGSPAEIPVPGKNDSGGGPPRTLTLPETTARMAGFLAARGRNEDAEDKLEDALMTEPSMPEAEQTLGFILLKKDDLDEAQKHFESAAQLDPKDGLNFYGQGLVALGKARSLDASTAAAAAFEKSVALNPDFAPAWHNLALIYAQRDETSAKALADAQRAAALAPGEPGYQLQVAELLNRLGHPDEARKAAAQVKESASDRNTANKAGDLVARLSQPHHASAPSAAPAPISPNSPPPKPPATSSPSLRIENKTEPQATPQAAPSPAPAPSASAAASASATPSIDPGSSPPRFSPTKVYSMIGTITDVNCTSDPQVQLTLKSLTIVMKLHAAELGKVSITSAAPEAAPKSASCSSLRGRSARISYVLVLDKPWDGEMQEVEFRNQP